MTIFCESAISKPELDSNVTLELLGTRDRPLAPNLDYGISQAWATPLKRVNLLESGIVPAALHQWLEDFADSPQFVSGPLSDYFEAKKLFIRYDVSIFTSPAQPELALIKDILIFEADQYARETIVDPLPEHDKYAYLWFVVQRPNNENEAVRPHFHEPGDFAWFTTFRSVE